MVSRECKLVWHFGRLPISFCEITVRKEGQFVIYTRLNQYLKSICMFVLAVLRFQEVTVFSKQEKYFYVAL